MAGLDDAEPVAEGGSGPLYVQVREHLRRRIAEMSVGQKLPPERELSDQFEVDRVTVRRAMQDLEREGFVVRHRGRGTFVRKAPACGRGAMPAAELIGLVIPDVSMTHSAQMLRGVEEEATSRGYEVLVCNSVLDRSRERSILERLSGKGLAGILVCPLFEDSMDPAYAELIQRLQDQGTRIVMLDQYIAGLDAPVAMKDKVRMGYLPTEHLIMLGHRRICYLTTGRYDTVGPDTLVGYRRALSDYGLEYDQRLMVEIPIKNSAVPAHDAVVELLRKDSRAFTAMVSPTFSMAYGGLRALHELGRRVPEDVAVIGADMYNNPDYLYVTHTVQPFEQMGREGVKLLLRDRDDGELKQHVLLPPRLVIGATCGARRPREE